MRRQLGALGQALDGIEGAGEERGGGDDEVGDGGNVIELLRPDAAGDAQQ